MFFLPNGRRRCEKSKNRTKQFDEFFSFFLGKFLANSKARQTKPRGMIFIKDFFLSLITQKISNYLFFVAAAGLGGGDVCFLSAIELVSLERF